MVSSTVKRIIIGEFCGFENFDALNPLYRKCANVLDHEGHTSSFEKCVRNIFVWDCRNIGGVRICGRLAFLKHIFFLIIMRILSSEFVNYFDYPK